MFSFPPNFPAFPTKIFEFPSKLPKDPLDQKLQSTAAGRDSLIKLENFNKQLLQNFRSIGHPKINSNSKLTETKQPATAPDSG